MGLALGFTTLQVNTIPSLSYLSHQFPGKAGIQLAGLEVIGIILISRIINQIGLVSASAFVIIKSQKEQRREEKEKRVGTQSGKLPFPGVS